MPHVLVADDDAWILRMVSTVLEKSGYSVETAIDGEDAMARAAERIPDLLITDVMMPRMDGWTLVRNLRARPETSMLPVIFLTALSSDDDRIRGFKLGADDYVTKPFRFEELDLRVAKTLRRAHAMVEDTREQLGAPSLRGDLAQVGLSSLLVLIEMERKTGLLSLRAPDGTLAQVLVRAGRPSNTSPRQAAPARSGPTPPAATRRQRPPPAGRYTWPARPTSTRPSPASTTPTRGGPLAAGGAGVSAPAGRGAAAADSTQAAATAAAHHPGRAPITNPSRCLPRAPRCPRRPPRRACPGRSHTRAARRGSWRRRRTAPTTSSSCRGSGGWRRPCCRRW